MTKRSTWDPGRIRVGRPSGSQTTSPGSCSSAMSRTASIASSSIPIDGYGTARSRAIMTGTLSSRRAAGPAVLEHVRDAVPVEVQLLRLPDLPVAPVARAQEPGGPQGREQRAGQDADLRDVIGRRARAVGQLRDEQR